MNRENLNKKLKSSINLTLDYAGAVNGILEKASESVLESAARGVEAVNWEKAGRKTGATILSYKKHRAAKRFAKEHDRQYAALNGATKMSWFSKASWAAALLAAGYLANEFTGPSSSSQYSDIPDFGAPFDPEHFTPDDIMPPSPDNRDIPLDDILDFQNNPELEL